MLHDTIRACYVSNVAEREDIKERAIAASEAMVQARLLMAGSPALDVIEDPMYEYIHDEVEKFTLTFIPKGADPDDLDEPLLNIAENVSKDGGVLVDHEYFADLEREIESFKRDYLAVWTARVAAAVA